MGIRLKAAHDLTGWQIIRWHLFCVINRADDQRLVGIAFEKSHDDFLPNTRQSDPTPVLASPRGSHSDETGRVFVVFTFAIPMELHFDPPVFIGVDFLAFWAGHYCRLQTLNHWLRR